MELTCCQSLCSGNWFSSITFAPEPGNRLIVYYRTRNAKVLEVNNINRESSQKYYYYTSFSVKWYFGARVTLLEQHSSRFAAVDMYLLEVQQTLGLSAKRALYSSLTFGLPHPLIKMEINI